MANAAALMCLTACGETFASKDNPAPAAAMQSASLDSLTSRARGALAKPGFNLVLSPMLPAAWPPASPAVEFFAYESMPLPSGVVSYRLTGPKFKLALTLPDGPPVLSPLENGQAAGTGYDRWPGAEDMRKAQEALLEVVAGRRDPEAAKADLRAYQKWSQFETVMGADARKRMPGFFGWLESEVSASAAPR